MLLQVAMFPQEYNGFTRTEYLSIFLSLLFAFSVAEVMLGWAKMLKSKKKLIFSSDHLVLTFAFFWVLIINWYTLWARVGALSKGFLYFLVSFLPIIIVYFWSLYLFPDFEEEKDLKKYTNENYRVIFGLWAAFVISNAIISIYLGELDITNFTVLLRLTGGSCLALVAIFDLRKLLRPVLGLNLLILLAGTIFISLHW